MRGRFARVTQVILTRLYAVYPYTEEVRRAAQLGGTFVGVILLGALFFWLPVGMTARSLSLLDAWMLSVSAITGSGAVPFSMIGTFTQSGLILLTILIHAGGVGVMAFVIWAIQLFGVPLFAGVVLQLRQIIIIAIGIEVVMSVVLALFWHDMAASFGDALFVAFFHVSSAFANSGFDLAGSGGIFDQVAFTTPSLVVMGVTVSVGALGLPLLFDISMKRSVFIQTRINLIMLGVVVLLSAFGVFSAPNWQFANAGIGVGERVVRALFESISARTSGIFVESDITSLPALNRVWLLISMFVGSAPGAMGGGVTPIALFVVLRAWYALFQGDRLVTLLGETLPPYVIRRAMQIVAIGAGVVVVSSMWLVLVDGMTFGDAVLLATSSFATSSVGESLLSQTSALSQFLLSLVMIWGRLGIFVLVLTFYRHVTPKQARQSPVWFA
jgi:trk system potassium uptake protein TrkH